MTKEGNVNVVCGTVALTILTDFFVTTNVSASSSLPRGPRFGTSGAYSPIAGKAGQWFQCATQMRFAVLETTAFRDALRFSELRREKRRFGDFSDLGNSTDFWTLKNYQL